VLHCSLSIFPKREQLPCPINPPSQSRFLRLIPAPQDLDKMLIEMHKEFFLPGTPAPGSPATPSDARHFFRSGRSYALWLLPEAVAVFFFNILALWTADRVTWLAALAKAQSLSGTVTAAVRLTGIPFRPFTKSEKSNYSQHSGLSPS
jgi:hypothetical protein